MKKIICAMLCILTFFSQVVCAKDLSFEYAKYIKSISKTLEQMDIVRNIDSKYNSDSLISRRDVFQMAYIVKNHSRELWYTPDDVDAVAELCEEKDLVYKNVRFIDVEPGTYDYALAYSLVYEDLLIGKADVDSEAIRADLDIYATYDEALTIIGRMLYVRDRWHTLYDELNKIVDREVQHPYYEAAIKNGLINSDLGSPQVTEDLLDQPISAYEFMHLLYRALYIPTVSVSDFGTYFEEYYINSFLYADIDTPDEDDDLALWITE